MNQRLVHDVAFVTTQHIVELFAGCIRPEEQRDAFAEVFERVKAGLEAFCIQENRMHERLRPGRN